MRRFVSIALTAGALLALAVTPATAAASPAPQVATSTEQCATYAVQQRIEAWLCVGGLLSYSEPTRADGTTTLTLKTVRVASDSPSSPAPTATQPEPTDFDTYCEFSGICTGYRSAYISWTKGNASYGNSSGGIGSFDIVLRTNLNGRQMQWRTEFWHDSGPALTFDNVFINCREDNTGPDSNCGVYGADNDDGDFYIGTGSYRSPVIYGNRLNDSNDYFATVSGYFVPTGYARQVITSLRSGQVNCFGGDPCYFRDA